MKGCQTLDCLLVSLAGWAGLLFAVSGWIRSQTKEFDDDLSKGARAQVANALQRATAKNADWMLSFAELFTRIFGNRHLSWLCLRRSLAISAAMFVLVGLATGPFLIDTSRFSGAGYSPVLVWLAWLTGLAAIGVVYNGFLDYLSLWVSRTVIKSRLPLTLKVAAGVLATLIVVYFLFNVTIGLLTYLGLSLSLQFEDTNLAAAIFLLFVLVITEFMEIPPDVGTVAFVIFATSFSTLIWLMLHALGVLAIRFVPPIFSRLDVRSKPVRAIGVVSAGLVWVFGLVAAAIYFLIAST